MVMDSFPLKLTLMCGTLQIIIQTMYDWSYSLGSVLHFMSNRPSAAQTANEEECFQTTCRYSYLSLPKSHILRRQYFLSTLDDAKDPKKGICPGLLFGSRHLRLPIRFVFWRSRGFISPLRDDKKGGNAPQRLCVRLKRQRRAPHWVAAGACVFDFATRTFLFEANDRMG